MKLLKEINEKDIGEGFVESFTEPYFLRKAARAVLLNDKNEVAFQYVSKHTYHKLPGGGVDEGETIEEAVKREILEEVGCDSVIGDEIGIIIEYRDKYKTLQISYCYFAKVKGEIGKTNYESKEMEEGHQPLWTALDDAIERIKNDTTDDYEGKFITVRDLAFLEEVRRIYS